MRFAATPIRRLSLGDAGGASLDCVRNSVTNSGGDRSLLLTAVVVAAPSSEPSFAFPVFRAAAAETTAEMSTSASLSLSPDVPLTDDTTATGYDGAARVALGAALGDAAVGDDAAD